MLISPPYLVNMCKKQKDFEVKMRLRGLINMHTKENLLGLVLGLFHFGIRCIAFEDFRCCTQQSVTKMTKAANTETIMAIKYELSSAFSRCVVAKEKHHELP